MRLRYAPIALLVVVGALYVWKSTWSLDGDLSLKKDFTQEYVLARTFLDGSSPYDSLQAEYRRYIPELARFNDECIPADGINACGWGIHNDLPMPHPPTVAPFVSLLGLFDYRTAQLAWYAFECAALAGSVALLLRINAYRVSALRVAVITVALFGWQPVLLDIGLGQVEILMLLLLVGSELALVRKRPALSGALWGLSLCIKPLALLLVIVYLMRRQYRALFGASLAVFAILAITTLRYGASPILYYGQTIVPMFSEIFRDSYANFSNESTAWRITLLLFGGENALFQRAVTLGLGLGCILYVFLWFRRERPAQEQYGAAILASLPLSPIYWLHYMTLGLIAFSSVKASRDRWINCSFLIAPWLLNETIMVSAGAFPIVSVIITALPLLAFALLITERRYEWWQRIELDNFGRRVADRLDYVEGARHDPQPANSPELEAV